MAPFVPDPGLVFGRCLGHGEPGAAEHPERELDQAVERPVLHVPALDQIPDELLDQPVGVFLFAFPPAVPAERGRAFQPDQASIHRVAAVGEVGIQRQHRRVPRVRRGRGGDYLRGRALFLQVKHGLEQSLLAGEVVVDGTAGHLAGGRDVLQRGPGVPTLGEQHGGLVEQRGPGGLRVQLAAALDLGHALSIVTNTVYVTSAEYVNYRTAFFSRRRTGQLRSTRLDRNHAAAAFQPIRTRLYRRPVPAVRDHAGAGAGVRAPVRVLAAYALRGRVLAAAGHRPVRGGRQRGRRQPAAADA